MIARALRRIVLGWTRKSRSARRGAGGGRAGFTLLEPLAVITLLGLVAGATAWSLASTARAAGERAAIEGLHHADALARLSSRRWGRPTVLVFDLERQEVIRRDGDGGGDRHAERWPLPAQVRIERVVRLVGDRVPGYTPAGSREGVSRSGRVEVAVSGAGRSMSYALILRLAGRGEGGGAETIGLVFAGLSGEMVRIDDAHELETFFEALRGRRAHAD